ncbi:hypothetical protein ACHQM5_016938 [Ranunculus cassubicifolius]
MNSSPAAIANESIPKFQVSSITDMKEALYNVGKKDYTEMEVAMEDIWKNCDVDTRLVLGTGSGDDTRNENLFVPSTSTSTTVMNEQDRQTV